MMLGKRTGRPAPARHHMRRTTSMTEFTPPDVAEEENEELQLPVGVDPYGWAIGGAGEKADWLAAYRARAAPALALAGLGRNSADAFLRACGRCNRRLGPGCDTFMYRGDTAFCSLECRQQHMTIEDWKDKCALATPPASDPVPPPPKARSPRAAMM